MDGHIAPSVPQINILVLIPGSGEYVYYLANTLIISSTTEEEVINILYPFVLD